MAKIEVRLSVEEFEKLIADSPKMKELYESLVRGTAEISGEDEAYVKALVANLMLDSLQTAKEGT